MIEKVDPKINPEWIPPCSFVMNDGKATIITYFSPLKRYICRVHDGFTSIGEILDHLYHDYKFFLDDGPF